MGTMQEAGKSSDEVWRVDPKSIPLMWEQVKEIIAEYDSGMLEFVTLQDVYEYIRDDKIELWIGLDEHQQIALVGLTHVIGTVKKYVELFWLGGRDVDMFIPAGLQKLEQWCALIGGSYLVVGGREGWGKKLVKYGYKKHRVEIRKQLSHVSTDEPGKVSWKN